MHRVTPLIDQLPYALYTAEQVRALDRCAIEQFSIPGATLMERAGQAVFDLLRRHWPEAQVITVVCGIGNNGGDGYVVARLAQDAGLQVHLLQLGDGQKLKGDALKMADAYRSAGGKPRAFDTIPPATEVLVDAVLGTGLEREVEGRWAEALKAMNAHRAPVLAVDIPSGLHSDAGRIMGVAVKADVTLSFIGLKRGMFTGAGPDCCGEIHFDALEVPARVYATQILSARRIDWAQQATRLEPRPRNAHKGVFGHVLVVGGAPGLSGAARMAGGAAARSGAGLTTIATHPDHAAFLNAGRPELMVQGVERPEQLLSLLKRATVVALGPGLGQTPWAVGLYRTVLESGLPLVMDADALNLLARDPQRRGDWVITPHPGEAARLLVCDVDAIESDRFAAVSDLQARFGGTVVLKGAGTLVDGSGHRPPAVCSDGNPGMASGGTGDLLTGIIAALIAQGFGSEEAATMGVCVHAAAGDMAAREGERGMLAGDLLPHLRPLLNPPSA
ncbi:MAG TPA: NAD(P)H-hydrate dehydratase [Kiloniellaceae bacterium]|nr:NAD(P)H-hydrate dehydratase [Kiloniellaceae bacterium]